MSTLGDILKVGATIGQFIPGGQLIGQGLGVLGGVLDASDAAKKKRKAQGQVQGQADKLGALGDRYTGLADTYLPSLTSEAVNSYKNFNPANFIDAPYRSIVEGTGASADNAVDATMQDFAGRGLTRDSSGLGAAVGNIRSNAQVAGSRTMSELILQAQREKQNRLMQALGLTQQLGQTGATLTSQSLGTMGGLEGMYASESNGLAGALGDLGGIAGQLSTRPSNAGQSTLNTNNAPSALPGLALSRDPLPTTKPRYKSKVSIKPTVTGGA
jgi:hypothetical protein